MGLRPDLIFDVGVCNGDDSAYYLHKGYRVVGIEANPLLIPHLERRFAGAIRGGRYELVPQGIADTDGEAEFWVCDDHPEWSSFDRTIASRRGARHHAVTVRICRFRSLLDRFGTPFYCKIDIEGHDDLCLQDMAGTAKPDFVSIEFAGGDRQLQLLSGLGYHRFKIVSQLTLRSPVRPLASVKGHLPAWLRKQFVWLESRVRRHRSDGSWRFPRGCSGSFGEDTPGAWVSAEEAARLVAMIERADTAEWHDIHASFGQR